MKILIDNGHYKGTPGKCSPDRSFFEWKFNREIAIPLVEELKKRGYDAERIVTEDNYDVTLTERCRRVNEWCNKLGKWNVIFISVSTPTLPLAVDGVTLADLRCMWQRLQAIRATNLHRAYMPRQTSEG